MSKIYRYGVPITIAWAKTAGRLVWRSSALARKYYAELDRDEIRIYFNTFVLETHKHRGNRETKMQFAMNRMVELVQCSDA